MIETSKTLGIGLIGCGFLAQTRMRCFSRIYGVSVRVRAVASRTIAKAESFANDHNILQALDDVDKLLAREDIHVVDLCVPNALHRSMTEKAAKAGKHVICTKPLSAYVGQDLEEPGDDTISLRPRRAMYRVAVEDAKAMLKVTRDAGVSLAYGENWIYAPSIVRAFKALETSGGVALEIKGWEAHSGSHSPYSKLWKHTGGGALLRLASHPVGAMLLLKRQEGLRRLGRPIRVTAVSAEVADLTRATGLNESNTRIVTGFKDVENWGWVVLHFDDGTRGVASGSDNLLGGMESRLEIHASNAHLKCRLSPNDSLRAYVPTDDVFGDDYLMEKVDAKSGWSTPMPDEDVTSGHQAMCQDFLESIDQGRSPISDGELGLDVVRVLYGAYVAADEGRRIRLDDLDSSG